MSCFSLIRRTCLAGLGGLVCALIQASESDPLAGVDAPIATVLMASGQALLAGRPAHQGDGVRVGQVLQTGADGHLYLQTIDQGLLILRPGSRGRIAQYHIDASQPQANRLRIELDAGLARSVSGRAVQQARERFRFNTPLAAIGVRGTDFSVFTDAQVTRVSVLSGAVVVSPLGDDCRAQDLGPCASALSRALGPEGDGRFLEVKRQMAPVLRQQPDLAPDRLAAATLSRTAAIAPAAALAGVEAASLAPLAEARARDLGDSAQRTALGPAPAVGLGLHWGRWQPVLAQSADLQLDATQRYWTNAFHAVSLDASPAWAHPGVQTLSMQFLDGQALLQQAHGDWMPAQIAAGRLDLDFARARFSTALDVTQASQRWQLVNQGNILARGELSGGYQFSAPNNMTVRGSLSADNLRAAYVFSAPLDDARRVSGVAAWGR